MFRFAEYATAVGRRPDDKIATTKAARRSILFHLEFDRLSVDIDLNYVGALTLTTRSPLLQLPAEFIEPTAVFRHHTPCLPHESTKKLVGSVVLADR